MTTLFFIIGIFYMIWEFFKMTNPGKYTAYFESIEDYNRHLEEDKSNVDFVKSLGIIAFFIFSLTYMMWGLIGLLASSQTILFAILFGMGLSITFLKHVLKVKYKNLTVVICIDSFISLIIMGIIIYNHFH